MRGGRGIDLSIILRSFAKAADFFPGGVRSGENIWEFEKAEMRNGVKIDVLTPSPVPARGSVEKRGAIWEGYVWGHTLTLSHTPPPSHAGGHLVGKFALGSLSLSSPISPPVAFPKAFPPSATAAAAAAAAPTLQ